MQSTPKPLAILISDLHLSLSRPSCRNDDDWMEVQKKALDFVKRMSQGLAPFGEGPLHILCAGDIFDRWNPTPELLHFALSYLPNNMICVPGQHDLAYHRADQMIRTGYGVLSQTGKIIDLHESWILPGGFPFVVYGAGWDAKIEKPDSKVEKVCKERKMLKILLCHKYVWNMGAGYPGAPIEQRIDKLAKELKPFDVAVFGDNHTRFSVTMRNGTLVYNCGGFLRRKRDEITYKPAIGILYDDGHIDVERIPVSHDKFHHVKEIKPEQSDDIKAFIDGLLELGEQGLDFREAVRRHVESSEVNAEVRKIILESIKDNL